MQFKIDTKDTYTVITPSQNSIDVKMTGELAQKIIECTHNGSANFMIDLKNCTTADNKSLEKLHQLHQQCYEAQQSFVITGMNMDILAIAKDMDIANELNITPTTDEAIDIISMDILERDLLNEE